MHADAVEKWLQLAGRLAAAGRVVEARNAYLEVLKRDPGHRLALNQLGGLLFGTGYRTAARTAYAEAVARHPDDPTGHVNLGHVLHDAGEHAAARDQFAIALRLAPDHWEAHQGMGYALAELGDEEGARWHRREGFRDHAVSSWPYRGTGEPARVLLLISAVGGNIPLRNLLDDRVFQTQVVAPEFFDAGAPLPEHQVVFNSIGDADLDTPALDAAETLLARTKAKVINRPAMVLETGRANQARLGRVPGVVAPAIATLPREALEGPEAAAMLVNRGFRFPLLVRTPGYQTGRHFRRVEKPEELAGAVAALPGRQLTVIEFLDARGAGGRWRKYRVMMIGGRLYPLHLAISNQWKVHYFTADMAEQPEHRAEEEKFLEDMPRVVGLRAMEALAGIQAVLGLDYGGVDFGLSPAGDLLFFEANATMVVNRPEPDARWDYRRAAVERVVEAVRSMLLEP